VPADARATEVVDSTLVAEPFPAAAALGSALHTARRVQSDSLVPEVCTMTACCYALCALPYGTLRTRAGPRRSEQQRERSAATCDATRTRATLVCVAEYNGIDRR
jgi:hypothetical protein